MSPGPTENKERKPKKVLSPEEKKKVKEERKVRKRDKKEKRMKHFKDEVNKEIKVQVKGGKGGKPYIRYGSVNAGLRSNGLEEVSNAPFHTGPVNAMTAPMRKVNGTTHDVVKAFEHSLTNPGKTNSPYIDDVKVTPAPHGVLTGSRQITANNANWNIIFLCPSLASASSANVAGQRAGLSFVTTGLDVTPIVPDDITNAAGSWIGWWGPTTVATRIFAWSACMSTVVNAPEAVQQGNLFYGNLPAVQVIGMTVAQLIQASNKIEALNPGNTYDLKQCIVDRNLPHGNTIPNTRPDEERVSYIIFPPNGVGSITGGAGPVLVTYTLQYSCNYFWQPLYQPQVTSTTEATIKEESRYNIHAEQLAQLNRVAQKAATQYGSGAVAMSDGDMVNFSDPLSSLQDLTSHASDLEYFTRLATVRWGPWDQFPQTVYKAVKEWFQASQKLENEFLEITKQGTAVKKRFDNQYLTKSVVEGRVVYNRKDQDGITWEDAVAVESSLRSLTRSSSFL